MVVLLGWPRVPRKEPVSGMPDYLSLPVMASLLLHLYFMYGTSYLKRGIVAHSLLYGCLTAKWSGCFKLFARLLATNYLSSRSKDNKKFEFICRQPIPTLPPKPSRLHAPTPTKILTLKTDYKTHNCSPSHASMPM